MSTDRDLGYDIYDVIPQDEALADVADVDNGSYDAVGADSAIGDVPTSLIESGAVEMGVSGVTVTADTSLDTYTPNLEEHEITHNLAFTVTDKDTVAWGSGTIYVGDNAGTTYAISAGNTGNMAARTYIFLDIAVSTTVLQTTTTVSGTVGPNRKLIAVAQNGVAEPQFTVYGGIGGIKLPATGTSISNNNWFFSGTWSVTDADTVEWGSGTLTTSNGGSYSITASNTANMAAKTYIYFDLAVSSTAFQKTTTAANAVGDGKILIAVAQNGTGEASYQVMNDFQKNIVAGQIVAGSITANEIATGTITASLITVSTLSAIVADLGAITAGTITLNSSGYIKGGQTAYDTGTGFFLGYSGSAYKFSIGNASGNRLTWDGSSLTVIGTVANVQEFTSSGTWTKPAGGSMAYVQLWGGGGSGGASAGIDNAGGGGGGGYVEEWIALSSLGATETVTIGDGGTAVTAVAVANVNGNAGSNSTFGSYLTAYGGGGGLTSDVRAGGGAGASSYAAASGIDDGGAGGLDTGGNGGNGINGGGGGGGGSDTDVSVGAGGRSLWGGGGGGGSYTSNHAGGGGSVHGGAGGTGMHSSGSGGSGGVRGGGGGGCTLPSGTAVSGAGGKGYCRVTVI